MQSSDIWTFQRATVLSCAPNPCDPCYVQVTIGAWLVAWLSRQEPRRRDDSFWVMLLRPWFCGTLGVGVRIDFFGNLCCGSVSSLLFAIAAEDEGCGLPIRTLAQRDTGIAPCPAMLTALHKCKYARTTSAQCARSYGKVPWPQCQNLAAVGASMFWDRALAFRRLSASRIVISQRIRV